MCTIHFTAFAATVCRKTGLACWCLCIFSTFLFADNLHADQPKKDRTQQVLETLQGTWIVESDLTDGELLQGHSTIIFRKNSYTMKFEPFGPEDLGSHEIKFDFVVDATTEPMTIREKITSAVMAGSTRTMIFRVKDGAGIVLSPRHGQKGCRAKDFRR